jgi:hypothetical protein
MAEGSSKENRATRPKKRDRWEWMRRYLPWEANRKEFLYPENAVEPEGSDTTITVDTDKDVQPPSR